MTARRQLGYIFTPKHHGADRKSACWLTVLTLAEEFAIFNRADGIVVEPPGDNRQVADTEGNIYGYERLPDGATSKLREIGTWYQQLAEFPFQADGMDWHGYPIYPVLALEAPENRKGHKCRPDTRVFDRMYELRDITLAERKQLKKGEQI